MYWEVSMSKKIRLDHLLVEKGLIENPSKAKARIMAGDVIVNDHRADKPGDKYPADINIRLRGNSHPFVSRGGLKLSKALEYWQISAKNKICLDVGASTGGFTHVLLNGEAKKVYAVDVGYGQLAQSLRVDDRVINMERTHIMNLSKKDFIEPLSLVVIDVSFISLSKILPHVVKLLDEGATIIALIKPQFEAGKEHVEKGGIIKDEKVHNMVINNTQELLQRLSVKELGVIKSPIVGAKGNIEFLIAGVLTRG